MSEPFLIGLRESLQFALLTAVVLTYPLSRPFFKQFILGALAGLVAGVAANALPGMDVRMFSGGAWTYLRQLTEAAVFFGSLLFISKGESSLEPARGRWGLAVLGAWAVFFEAGALRLYAFDTGATLENIAGVIGMLCLGIMIGVVILFVFVRFIRDIKVTVPLTLSGLLMALGALKFAMGGVGELEPGSILIGMQRGMQNVLAGIAGRLEDLLMAGGHTYLDTPHQWLLGFMASDRAAMTAMALVITVPPVLTVLYLLSTPDPLLADIETGAERRLATSFFRRDLMMQAVPMIGAFFVLFFLVHAVNLSLNPMYEPEPLPLRAEQDSETLRVPLVGPLADLSDQKLKKFVYYHGDREIVFIAILKPDGTFGVALDQCEICDPADWNQKARGYAQRGENLVCKYCMTPIAASTVNKPGGCNPIPVPFRMDGDTVIVALQDLVSVYNRAEELDKKGSHL